MSLTLTMGICIGVGILDPETYLVSTGVFATFLVAQLTVLIRGQRIACGCFGQSEEPIGIETIGIAAVFFVFSLFLFIYESR